MRRHFIDSLSGLNGRSFARTDGKAQKSSGQSIVCESDGQLLLNRIATSNADTTASVVLNRTTDTLLGEKGCRSSSSSYNPRCIAGAASATLNPRAHPHAIKIIHTAAAAAVLPGASERRVRSELFDGQMTHPFSMSRLHSDTIPRIDLLPAVDQVSLDGLRRGLSAPEHRYNRNARVSTR